MISPTWVIGVRIQNITLIIVNIVNTIVACPSGEDDLEIHFLMYVRSTSFTGKDSGSKMGCRSCRGDA